MKEELEALCKWLQSYPADCVATMFWDVYSEDEPVMKIRKQNDHYYRAISEPLYEFLYNGYVDQRSRRYGFCSEIVSNEKMQQWMNTAYRVLVVDDLIVELR